MERAALPRPPGGGGPCPRERHPRCAEGTGSSCPVSRLYRDMPAPAQRSAWSALRVWLRPRTRVMHACHTAARARLGWRPLQNLARDLWHGGWAGGVVRAPAAAQGASRVQSTDYAALAKLHRRNGIRIHPDDVLVDVGCGRGRVINWWLGQGLRNRMIGLELVPGIARETAHRLRRHPNVEVRAGDAVEIVPREATFLYLYNPFDARVMRRFAEVLLARADRPQALRIVYFNCRHLDVFADDPRWCVRPLDTGEPEPAALITRAR